MISSKFWCGCSSSGASNPFTSAVGSSYSGALDDEDGAKSSTDIVTDAGSLADESLNQMWKISTSFR